MSKPHDTWVTNDWIRRFGEVAKLERWIDTQLSAGGVDGMLSMRIATGRPRQGELRRVLERKRSRRARLDPITWVDNVARWVCPRYTDGYGVCIVRTMITPRGMYHLSVHGPVLDRELAGKSPDCGCGWWPWCIHTERFVQRDPRDRF